MASEEGGATAGAAAVPMAGAGMSSGIERAPASRLDARPLSQGDRLETLDVLRGFAVLGILAMNIMSFSGPFAGYMNPSAWPLRYEGLNRVCYWVTHLVFDMKMMSLFAMLFGAGVIVWSAKERTKADAGPVTFLWLRRMFWLLVIGMVHAYALWEGDILVAYALTGIMVAWWARRWPVWGLLAGASALFVIHIALTALNGAMMWMAFAQHPEPLFGMSETDFAQMQDGFRQGMKPAFDPTAEMLADDIATKQGSYVDVLLARWPVALMIQTFGFAMSVFWRAAALMLLGMALVRTGVFTGTRSPRFYAIFAAVNYAIGLGLVVWGGIDSDAYGHDPARVGLHGLLLNTIGSLPVALGHAGLLILVIKIGALGWVRRALASAGQMAFTNYLSQTLICTTLFYGYGFGLYGQLDRPALLGIVAAIWALQLVWSPLWLSRFRFGPAEWAWRSLTYWKVQPMRRGGTGRAALSAGA